jgi:hypothetical protein
MQGPSDEVILGAVVATKLVPNFLVLLFFSACSQEWELRVILRVMFACALVVVACMVLAHFGLLASSDYVSEGNITRLTAGTSWSTLPLFLTVPAAGLGGMLLVRRELGTKPVLIAFAAAASIGTLFAALVSGQRTSAALFAICLVFSAGLYMARLSARNVVAIAALLMLGTVVLQYFNEQFSEASSTLLERTARSRGGVITGDVEDRRLMYGVFFEMLARDPSITPPGVSGFVQQTGNIPHLIFGEAYCYGGLPMLAVMLFLFTRAWSNAVSQWIRSRNHPAHGSRVALLAILLGFTLTLLFHPGLHTRIVYMVLGLALAREARSALQWAVAERVPIMPGKNSKS